MINDQRAIFSEGIKFMVCPRFFLATAIVSVTLASPSLIAEAVDLGQDYPQKVTSALISDGFDPDFHCDQTGFALRLERLQCSQPLDLAQGIAQAGDVETYQQLFVPQHRRQPGRKPFDPNQLTLQNPPSQDPGVSLGTPSGYGAAWRSVGVGLGLQSRTRYSNQADGTFGVGIGFGNPAQTVGLQVGIGFVDLTDPFADGTLSLKLHRQLPQDMSIAIGGSGVLTWGNPDGGTSVYGVVSKRFSLKDSTQKPLSQITTSFGIGSGQFRSESAVNQGKDGVGAFGSVAMRFAEPVNGIVEWTGQDLNVGVSITPFRNIPLVITPAVNDVTGSAGDGARFVVGIGYGITF